MRRDQHQRLVSAALLVLDEAAYRSSIEAVATSGVRLALRVLLPYVACQDGLLAFWGQGQAPAPHPWKTCREAYYLVAKSLRDAGWDAPPLPIMSSASETPDR